MGVTTTLRRHQQGQMSYRGSPINHGDPFSICSITLVVFQEFERECQAHRVLQLQFKGATDALRQTEELLTVSSSLCSPYTTLWSLWVTDDRLQITPGMGRSDDRELVANTQRRTLKAKGEQLNMGQLFLTAG